MTKDSLSQLKLKPGPYTLYNKIQHYAWGTRGDAAFIPRFLGQKVAPDLPYAELWMGAHPKASSEVELDGTRVSLRRLVQQAPREVLGKAVCENFAGTWPFLFKVLSISAPLSIQAHPNKIQAQLLHARDPEHYPDDNHKPEVAVALDSLIALVGFKCFSDILKILDMYPEITDFIGKDIANSAHHVTNGSATEQQTAVRLIYATLMRKAIAEREKLARSIQRLDKRLRQVPDLSEHATLFLDLRKIYDGAEVGLFALFFLNLIHLQKGQGVFLKSGIPHAYLKGNIVECMANSDNVVRAGLTPKFKDIETLIDILTYDLSPPPVLVPNRVNSCILSKDFPCRYTRFNSGLSGLGEEPTVKEVVYPTPVPDFQLSRWTMEGGEEKREVTGDRPEILLITRGEALIRWGTGTEREEASFRQGQSMLIPASLIEFQLVAQQSAEIFKATVPQL